MYPIHTIVMATDFSDESKAAFSLACGLARDYGARLLTCHIVSYPVSYGELVAIPASEDLYAQAKRQIDQMHVPNENVRVERLVESGDPAQEILALAARESADAIVMGTHGRTGLRRLLMGSVAERVLRNATCPVITVSNPARFKVAADSYAQDQEKAPPEDVVQAASEGSFPASDAPGWVGGVT